ncbi:hypothetical protein BGX27_005419 [Mortierella sp. AM989]|nr:hypothetical protein BGX27_005419 [Mortierella sp. AM989]
MASLSPSPSSSSASSSRSTIADSSVPVLIAGGGPVGLFEAILLTKLGIQVRVIEREMSISPMSKAIGMHPRSLEILGMAGIVGSFLERGKPLEDINLYIGSKHKATVSAFGRIDSHFTNSLILEQAITSEVLVEELDKLGVKVEYGWELLDTKVVEDSDEDKDPYSEEQAKKTFVETRIRRALSGGNSTGEEKILGEVKLLEEQVDKEYEIQVVRSEYLVAADGGRSTVRHKLNIGFPGRTLDFKTMMWDGTFEGDMKFQGITNIYGVNGKTVIVFPLTNDGFRVVVDAGRIEPGEDMSKTLEDLTVEKFEGFVNASIAPSKFKVTTTSWLTVFKINERRAEHFVYKNRIFLAGDSAHVHSPTGGQGLNTGLQDAHNLAWKLAFVLNGVAPESLLETYEEREDMADRAIALSSMLLGRSRTNGFFSHIMKLASINAAPLIDFLSRKFDILPDFGMMNVKYHENTLNKPHPTQPRPPADHQVGVRAREGLLRSILPSNSLKSEVAQIRLHELMRSIGRFHILVFTSDMLASNKISVSGTTTINGTHTTNAKELDHNIDSFVTKWRSKWAYALNMQDGHKDNNDLFKVHTISGSVAFESDDKVYLDALIERSNGNGKIYLDDTKLLHQRYGFAWDKGAGGIVVVRPDSHVGYRVNGAGEQAWKDVEEYFTRNLSA